MPQENITETGPQTGTELQKLNNDEFRKYFSSAIRNWDSYGELRRKGLSDSQAERLYRDIIFKNTFRQKFNTKEEYNNWAHTMTPEQRDIYLLNEANGTNTRLKEISQYPEAPTLQGITNIDYSKSDIAKQAPVSFNEVKSLNTKAEATAYNDNVWKEAEKLYPSDKSLLKTALDKESDMSTLDRAVTLLDETFNDRYLPAFFGTKGNLANWIIKGVEHYTGKNINLNPIKTGRDYILRQFSNDENIGANAQERRVKYYQEHAKLPVSQNQFYEISEEDFIKNIGLLSNTYNTYGGTKWLPDSDVNFHELYEQNKQDLNAGLIWKVNNRLDEYFNEIVGKRQPKGFGGDDIMHGKAQVFFEQAAAGAVENLMDAALVPAGLIEGGAAALINGTNYWDEASYLPSLAHDVAKNITGEYSTAYGSDWFSALANSGYTIGTMAIDAALMAAPTKVAKVGNLFKATKEFDMASRAARLAKFDKIYGTAMSINFGLAEGTVDALDVRKEILDNAQKRIQNLPYDEQEAVMAKAIDEANAAYGRTVLEESLVVNTGTLLGLGFLGGIAPTKLIRFKAPNWQRLMASSSKLGKAASFAGHTVEGITKLSLGELMEEYAQGMSSGINKARAEYNINNYAEGLHYGLGSEYLNEAHVGFMQGLERFAPRAWVEMDPENLTKQVILSTLLFRGLKVPGFGGKTRAQIQIDNNNAIGKLWDNVRKFSPVQTGIGQIIADAKADTFDVENSLQRGFTQLINDPNVIDVMQDQAALTDIGVQMTDALNRRDISKYSQTSAAYQVAQGIMLANAQRHNTKFGRDYVKILEQRANFNELSTEEQEQVFKSYLEELQINSIGKLSQEEQINIMTNTAKQSLELMNQASEIMDRLSNDTNLEGQDIRPLAFAELLYKSAPKTMNDNWETVSSAIKNSDITSVSDEQLQKDGIDPELFKELLNNYFLKDNVEDRNPLNGKRFDKEFKKEDISKTLNYMTDILEKTDPWVKTYVKNDLDLAVWRRNIRDQWNRMYERVREGETVFDEPGFLDRISDKVDNLINTPRKQKKRFIKDLRNARGLADTYKAYNDALNDTGLKFDVENAINSIKDPNIKKQVNQVKAIMRAQNSVKAAITKEKFDDILRDNLYDQVDMVASRAESVDELFDISKYSFAGVRPDLIDQMSGKLQNALTEASKIHTTGQTIDPSNVRPQSETNNSNKETNLDDRDINTTPATNDTPVTKYTKDEADNIINEINDFMNSDSYDGDVVADKIDDLSRRCPDGYKIVRGGTRVAMIKVVQETVINEVDDEELDTNIDFIPEEYVIDNDEVIPVDESLNAYPDNDVRSVTMVAVGKFSPEGHYYAFPIRDEQVDNTTRAQASYTDGKGVTHTNVTGPLEIITVEDYNKRTESDPKEFKSLEEIVKNYPRPTFVNQENKEIPKVEQRRSFTTNRTEAQQQRLNNNITNSRNEISYEDQHSSKERLADVAHRSIDTQLNEQGAFEYRNSGALQIGDKISFVCSVETMPDGKDEVVIWEVTKPKDKQIPSDGKFKGMQVLDVLDQTNMSGDRKDLIERIRKAYDNAGRPTSFLYDKEEFEVTNIIDGTIPFKETNPIEAISDNVIENNNLKNSLSESNGKYGVKFFNPKTGKFTIVPAILRQTERRANNTTINKPTRKINEVEVLKKERATQNPTREVMLVVPTPIGYKAVHSVYVMKRGIEGAVEKYKQAINNGSIGRVLIDRIKQKMIPSNFKNPTSFSDFFTFGRYVNEHIKYFDTHDQLELGYTRGDLTVLIYAHRIGDNKWVETGRNVSEVINDNNGQGFTLDDICKMYLERLIDDPVADASLRINIDAMAKDVRSGQEILNALINDGMLWTPNSIGSRIGIENVGFSASINKETSPKIQPKEVVKEQAQTQVTAPVEKALKPESVKPRQVKQDVDVTKTNVGSHINVPRAKKRAITTQPVDPTPNSTKQEQQQQQQTSSVIDYNNLTRAQKQSIEAKGITEEQFNSLTANERNNLINCID